MGCVGTWGIGGQVGTSGHGCVTGQPGGIGGTGEGVTGDGSGKGKGPGNGSGKGKGPDPGGEKGISISLSLSLSLSSSNVEYENVSSSHEKVPIEDVWHIFFFEIHVLPHGLPLQQFLPL